MRSFYNIMIILMLGLSLAFAQQTKWAGVRSSYYGARPWLSLKEWKNINRNMAKLWQGSSPTAIWIVGGIRGPNCYLEFKPDSGKSYKNIVFQPQSDYIVKNPNTGLYDTFTHDHEKILTHFDSIGVKVFLQVEPGMADLIDCAEAVLDQFKQHPCVLGFGVDLEWYPTNNQTNDSIPLSDSLAELLEKKVKSYNPGYRLFLKHFESSIMPASYRGDIIFINDSQGMNSLLGLASPMARWASTFSPNPVMFQIGYAEDYSWWKDLTNPPLDMGTEILNQMSISDQPVGFIWVDFTFRKPEVQFLFNETDIGIKHPLVLKSIGKTSFLKMERNGTIIVLRYKMEPGNPANLDVFSSTGKCIKTFYLEKEKGTIVWEKPAISPGLYVIHLHNRTVDIVKKVQISTH